METGNFIGTEYRHTVIIYTNKRVYIILYSPEYYKFNSSYLLVAY